MIKENCKYDSPINWLFGLVFIVIGVTFIRHPFAAISYGLLGFIILPPGHKFIEKMICIRLTATIKTVLVAILFLTSGLFARYYNDLDKISEISSESQQISEVENVILEDKNSKEKIRKDSLNHYLKESKSNTEGNKLEESMELLNKAELHALTNDEHSLINKQRIKNNTLMTIDLVNKGKFQEALLNLDNLLLHNNTDTNLLYNRAICYTMTKRTQEAVVDCKAAIQLGSKDAIILHNKINPVKKRFLYYVTRCCDGSTTNRKGKGTCSRHGGVCNWSEPVYEDYREY